MALDVAVIRFPGTNCEFDVVEAVESLGAAGHIVFHDQTSLGTADAVVVAGGFAHGDYLRPGAIARFSPIMAAVSEFAAAGGPVVGICNGFQVLAEAHLLPGALQKNAGLKFRCGMTQLRVESTDSVLTSNATVGDVLDIPINHFEGNYTCSPETLAELPLRGPGGRALRRQPERLGRRHRRDLQRRSQRGGPDAAPRARLQRPVGVLRRCGDDVVDAGCRRRAHAPRLTPARSSTDAGTPTSRHAVHEMPLRSL